MRFNATWCLVMLFSVTAASFNSLNLILRNLSGTEKEARLLEMVLDNLRRFHNGEDPVAALTPKEEYLEPLPLTDDILCFIGSELVSLKEANSLFSTCKYIDQLRPEMINGRLAEFNKHYVFEEQWLNNLMYLVIQKNFPAGFTLESEGIHDHLELMTLNFIRDLLQDSHEIVFVHVYHVILAFMHETVYGPGYGLPIDSWQSYAALKIKGFDLPSTFELYTQIFGQDGLSDMYQFFSVPRSDLEKENYAMREQRIGNASLDLAGFDWYFEGHLPEEKAKGLLFYLGECQIYSEHILKRVELTPAIDEYLIGLASEPSSHIYVLIRRYLHRKAGSVLDEPIFDCASYIMTRDLDRRFDFMELTTFADFEPWTVFRLVVTTDLPQLIKMDMLGKLARSGLVPLNLKEPNVKKSSLQILAENDLPFLEIVLENFAKLVNFQNFEYHLSGRVSRQKKRFMLASQFPKNNPLAVLMYMSTVFPVNLRINDAEKYNLNVKYRFDSHLGLIFGGYDISVNWTGKTLTFREILADLRQRFCSPNLETFFENGHVEESEEMKASYPVISISEYLNDPNSVLS